MVGSIVIARVLSLVGLQSVAAAVPACFVVLAWAVLTGAKRCWRVQTSLVVVLGTSAAVVPFFAVTLDIWPSFLPNLSPAAPSATLFL